MKQIGDRGEAIAKDFLRKQGYKVLETNFRVHRIGEIDLVAQDGETLVFVEVKYRKSITFGRPEEYVDKRKRERLIRAAKAYLLKHTDHKAVRFDVVAVTGEMKAPQVRHIPNAFWA